MTGSTLRLADFLYTPSSAFGSFPSEGSNTNSCLISPYGSKTDDSDKSKKIENKNQAYRDNVKMCEFWNGKDPYQDEKGNPLTRDPDTTKKLTNFDTTDNITKDISICNSVNGDLKEIPKNDEDTYSNTKGKCVYLSPSTYCESLTADECAHNTNYGCELKDGFCFDGNQTNKLPINYALYHYYNTSTPQENDVDMQKRIKETEDRRRAKFTPPTQSGKCLYLPPEVLDSFESDEKGDEEYRNNMDILFKQKMTDCTTIEGCGCKMCSENACVNLDGGESEIQPPVPFSDTTDSTFNEEDYVGSSSEKAAGYNKVKKAAKYIKIQSSDGWSILDFLQSIFLLSFGFEKYPKCVTWNEKRPLSTDHGWEVVTDYIDYFIFDRWERGWTKTLNDYDKGGEIIGTPALPDDLQYRNNNCNGMCGNTNNEILSGRCLDYDEIINMICDYDSETNRCAIFNQTSDTTKIIWSIENHSRKIQDKIDESNDLNRESKVFPSPFIYRDERNNARDYSKLILNEFKNALNKIRTEDGTDQNQYGYGNDPDFINLHIDFNDTRDIYKYIDYVARDITNDTRKNHHITKIIHNIILELRALCQNAGQKGGVGYSSAGRTSENKSHPKEIKAPPFRQSKPILALSTMILMGIAVIILGIKMLLKMALGSDSWTAGIFGFLSIMPFFIWIHVNFQPSIFDSTIEYIHGEDDTDTTFMGNIGKILIKIFIALIIPISIYYFYKSSKTSVNTNAASKVTSSVTTSK